MDQLTVDGNNLEFLKLLSVAPSLFIVLSFFVFETVDFVSLTVFQNPQSYFGTRKCWRTNIHFVVVGKEKNFRLYSSAYGTTSFISYEYLLRRNLKLFGSKFYNGEHISILISSISGSYQVSLGILLVKSKSHSTA